MKDADKLLGEVGDDLWRLSLADYAEVMSGGRWVAWSWLRYVADLVSEAVWEGDGRIILNAPPQHGKSELISHWLPTWFLDLFPEKRVILTSYADSLASGFGRVVRNELAGNNLRWTHLASDSTAADDWRTNKGGGMLCAGVAGGITGKGGDLLIVDDPFKGWREAQSAHQRRTVIDWFNGTLYTRRQPGTTIVVVQTRWHEWDLTGYLTNEHGDDWRHFRAPAIAEKVDELGRPEGAALCPQRFTLAEIESARVIGSEMFNGLYQQRPSPAEGSIIKRHWLRYYDTVPEGLERQWQSWDLIFDDDNPQGSFVVGQVWGQKGSNCYLLHQYRERVDFVTTIAALLTVSKGYPLALEKKVEKKANGSALLSVLRPKVPGLLAVTPIGDKPTRLRAVSPLFEAGNVWLPKPEAVAWVGDYVEELVTFPKSENDDQCDATSMGLNDIQQARLSGLNINLEVGYRPSPLLIGTGGEAPHLSSGHS